MSFIDFSRKFFSSIIIIFFQYVQHCDNLILSNGILFKGCSAFLLIRQDKTIFTFRFNVHLLQKRFYEKNFRTHGRLLNTRCFIKKVYPQDVTKMLNRNWKQSCRAKSQIICFVPKKSIIAISWQYFRRAQKYIERNIQKKHSIHLR